MITKVQKNITSEKSERLSLPALWQELLESRLPAVLQASRQGDEQLAIIATRRLLAGARELDPEVAVRLERAVSTPELAAAGMRRSSAISVIPDTPPPSSHDGALALMRRTEVADQAMPLLDAGTGEAVEQFLAEHRASEQLQRANLTPRTTIFLDGPPGVGKTALSQGIAHALHVPHYQLELSSIMSSLLGKTGQHLHEVLEYARTHHIVLLLDEFDAIAKRRDDIHDLGELKRVVSVLLKELEEWQGPSIIVTATNHVSLIDPAMIRRFQLRLSLPLPDAEQARNILSRYLVDLPPLPDAVMNFASEVLNGVSGSDIRQIALQTLRQACLRPTAGAVEVFLEAISARAQSRKEKKRFCQLADQLLSRHHGSFARIARLLDVSKTTISNYTKSVELT
jgi:SpoVK/Ycf46/Vps4 family AAA+-type ATPase